MTAGRRICGSRWTAPVGDEEATSGHFSCSPLVGTNKLPWEALGNVRELYLCLDLDVTGEGQKAAHKLAREAVLRGVPVHMMEDGAYGGYSEPSDQWEAEGRVTWDAGLTLQA